MAQPEMIQRLKNIPRLSLLSDEALVDLARVVTTERRPPGAVLCHQGELEDKFYAIELGEVLVRTTTEEGQEIPVTRLTEGDVFGERALIGDRPRTATVTVETTADLFALNKQDYQRLVRKHPLLERILVGPKVVPLLRKVPLFSQLSEEELTALSEYGGIIFYPPDRRVVKQGDMGVTLYVVSEGELVAYQRDARGQTRPVKVLKPGDAFGQNSLLIGETRDATVMTRAYTELYYINQASFAKFLNAYPGVRNKLAMREEVKRKKKAGAFEDQARGEIVEIQDSKHWVAFVRAIWRPALLLSLVGAGLAAIDLWLLGSPEATIGLDWLLIILTILWILAAAAVFIWHWVDWRNDYHIITTQRVIHIENELLRSTSREEVPIHQVQSIDIEQDLWGEVLGYGHMRITTAGATGGPMALEYVLHPEEFQRVIFEQMSRARFRIVAEERDELREAIRRAMRGSVLEEEVKEAPPPPPMERRSWTALLTQNWIARRLRKTMTESGLAIFLRRPHLPREELREGNRVIWRKHWGILLLVTWRPLLLSSVILGLLLGTVAGHLGWPLLSDVPPSWLNGILLALSLLAIPAVGWLIWEVEDWRNDLYIVTDTHIIDIRRRPLLLEEFRSQAELDDIQTTNASTKGFWAGVFKIGDVEIETAGEGTFKFEKVRYPHKVLAEIEKRRKADKARRHQQELAQGRAERAQWFAAYHDVAREMEMRARRRYYQLRPDWAKDLEEEDGQEV